MPPTASPNVDAAGTLVSGPVAMRRPSEWKGYPWQESPATFIRAICTAAGEDGFVYGTRWERKASQDMSL